MESRKSLNWLNQGLIEIKIAAKDVISNFLFGNNGGGNPPTNPPVNPPVVSQPINPSQQNWSVFNPI